MKTKASEPTPKSGNDHGLATDPRKKTRGTEDKKPCSQQRCAASCAASRCMRENKKGARATLRAKKKNEGKWKRNCGASWASTIRLGVSLGALRDPESASALSEQRNEPLLRRRMNIELNFPPKFEGLVLGCIDADFCK